MSNATLAPALNDTKVTERVDKTIIKVITTETPNPAPKKVSDASTPGAQSEEKKTAQTKLEVKPSVDAKGIEPKAEDNKTDGNKTETVPKPAVKPEETPVPANGNGTKPAGGKDEPPTPHAAVTEKTTITPKQPASEAPVLVAARGYVFETNC